MNTKNPKGVPCHCCDKLVFNIQQAEFKGLVVNVCRQCAWKHESGYSFISPLKEDFDLIEVTLKKGEEVLASNIINSRLLDAYAVGKLSLDMLFPDYTYNEKA